MFHFCQYYHNMLPSPLLVQTCHRLLTVPFGCAERTGKQQSQFCLPPFTFATNLPRMFDSGMIPYLQECTMKRSFETNQSIVYHKILFHYYFFSPKKKKAKAKKSNISINRYFSPGYQKTQKCFIGTSQNCTINWIR